jgi:hypothetical protein
MVAHIVAKYNAAPMRGKQEDDIVIAQLVTDVANWDSSLNIYIPMLYNNEVELGHHAYRCRIDHLNFSPAAAVFPDINKIIDNDIAMMHKIHNILTNGQTDNHSVLQEQDKN